MNKKWYIVIVSVLALILVVLSLILYFVVFSSDKVNRKAFNEHIDKIHSIASTFKFDDMKIGDTFSISLDRLKEAGYKSLINPYTKKEYPLNTNVFMTKKSDSNYFYRYEYEDNCKYNGLSCLKDKIKDSLNNNSINYQGGTYYKGSNDKIRNNYLWFSGQEYRIMGINSDGSIKLVSSLPVVSLSFGNVNSYKDSYVRKWLNELDASDIYDGVFYNSISRKDYLTDYDFCIDGLDLINNEDTTCNVKLTDKIGLLTWYEYKLLGDDSYLDINDRILFMTRDNRNSNILMTNSDGNIKADDDYVSNSLDLTYSVGGIRPVINLIDTVSIKSGDGTKNNPYILSGDSISKDDYLSTRYPGEYIMIGNYKYRIVSRDDSLNVKLVSDNRIKSTGTSKGEAYTYFDKGIDSSNLCNTSWPYNNCNNKFDINDGADDYDGNSGENIGYFLNSNASNSFYSSLQNYKDELVQSSYYLGKWKIGNDYKDIYTNANTNGYGIVKSYVGMLQYGEYLAGNNIESSSNAYNYWLITPYDSSVDSIYITVSGNLTYNFASFNGVGVRPTIAVSSSTKIKSGTGTKNDPFIIF